MDKSQEALTTVIPRFVSYVFSKPRDKDDSTDLQ